ncbi:DUF5753 domain-containing protein [Lentzea sp.]|uniref:DUF5753 domain-containing protein n=1 Tax=Lentzea sp. TaxID=56099 RepID=UPI002ED5C12B
MRPPDRIKEAVRHRMDRQAFLRSHDRPECTYFIHENALRLQVGTPAVMEEQFRRLLFLSHALRVVPASSGPAGVFMANYMVWEYEKRSTVAFTDCEIAQVFVQDPAGVKDCKTIFERLDAIALNETQSRAMVADLAGQARDEHSRQLHLTQR